jgi:hypothetical protein
MAQGFLQLQGVLERKKYIYTIKKEEEKKRVGLLLYTGFSFTFAKMMMSLQTLFFFCTFGFMGQDNMDTILALVQIMGHRSQYPCFTAAESVEVFRVLFVHVFAFRLPFFPFPLFPFSPFSPFPPFPLSPCSPLSSPVLSFAC